MDWKDIAEYLWLAFVGLLWWLLRKHVNRLDDLEHDVNELKREMVTREELDQKFQHLDRKLDATRAEITGRLDKVIDRLPER